MKRQITDSISENSTDSDLESWVIYQLELKKSDTYMSRVTRFNLLETILLRNIFVIISKV